MSDHFHFYLFTNKKKIAKKAHKAGVDTLVVDLETLGKEKRQRNFNSWKTTHIIDDINHIKEAIPDCKLMVRINPFNVSTKLEIDEVISRGADEIMLPMFKKIDEVNRFIDYTNSRASVVLLVETSEALDSIFEITKLKGIYRIHIGLNDLHIDKGYKFMFQAFSEGILEKSCSIMKKKGINFGIGGIARAGEGLISPDLILGEHVRLGSNSAILSRTFFRNPKMSVKNFALELQKLRSIYKKFKTKTVLDLKKNQEATSKLISYIVKNRI